MHILELFSNIIATLFKTLAEVPTRAVEGSSQTIPELHLQEPPTTEKEKEESTWIPWVYTAETLMGTKEIAGSKSNATIMGWAKNVGGWITSYYKNDDIPWCGLFVDHCLRTHSIEITIDNPLGARNWAKFGFEVEPCPGAIMVFSRSGGGHVGFYVSEDDKYYHILGGNQSNTVNVTKIAKSRFLAARWPNNYPTLHSRVKGRVYKKFDGTVSINEA